MKWQGENNLGICSPCRSDETNYCKFRKQWLYAEIFKAMELEFDALVNKPPTKEALLSVVRSLFGLLQDSSLYTSNKKVKKSMAL